MWNSWRRQWRRKRSHRRRSRISLVRPSNNKLLLAVSPQIYSNYTIFQQKRFPLMFPETTLNFLETTLNLYQTLTIESVFQYRMNYGVNFQIKKKWILYPLFLLCLFRTKANPNKKVYTFEKGVLSVTVILLTIKGTHYYF